MDSIKSREVFIEVTSPLTYRGLLSVLSLIDCNVVPRISSLESRRCSAGVAPVVGEVALHVHIVDRRRSRLDAVAAQIVGRLGKRLVDRLRNPLTRSHRQTVSKPVRRFYIITRLPRPYSYNE